jgi:Na+/melibiose symporter-like transporter
LSEAKAPPLARRSIWAYGLLGFPLALLGYPLGIWLPPAYSTGVGIDLATVGFVISAAAIFDAVTDPVVGFTSDRISPPLGRRRGLITIGAPLLTLAVWMLLTPSEGSGVLYLAFWFLFLRIGSTLVLVPYGALGAELSPDYHTRTLINSWRQRFVILGLLAAAFVPAIAELLLGDGATALVVLDSYSWLVLICLPLAALVTVGAVREPHRREPAQRTPIAQSLRLMWGNDLFRRVMVIELVITGGEHFRNALSVFFMTRAIGIESPGTLYVLYFAMGLGAIPLWDWIARRFGKHRSLAAAMVLVSLDSIAIFAIFMFDFFRVEAFVVLFAVKGLCFGAFSYLPLAMLADVVDIDTARSGDARTGSYFAAHGFMTKCAGSFGGLSLPVLALTGFDAAAGASNDFAALTWLGVLYALVPTALFGLAFWICWNWPLTAEKHAELRRQLDEENAAAGADAT